MKTLKILIIMGALCFFACDKTETLSEIDSDFNIDIYVVTENGLSALKDSRVANQDFRIVNDIEAFDNFNVGPNSEGTVTPVTYYGGHESGTRDFELYFAGGDGHIHKYHKRINEPMESLWAYDTGAPLTATVTAFTYHFNHTYGSANSGENRQEDFVYAGNTAGKFVSLHGNGDEYWSYTLENNAPIHSSAVHVDGHGLVVFGADDGYVYALNAYAGDLWWRFDTGGAVRSSPVNITVRVGNFDEASGKIIIGNDIGKLYALDIPKKEVIWEFDAGSAFKSSPYTWDNKDLYVGCNNAKMYKLNAETGSVIWEFQAGGAIESSPVYNTSTGTASENGIYFGSDDGILYCIDSNDGALIWKTNLNAGPIKSSPTVESYYDIVYVNTPLGVFGLNAETGEIQSEYPVPADGFAKSSPVVISYDDYDDYYFSFKIPSISPIY
ncbi:outer membrane protein assembly factor BamB family protein [Gelatiniphilus marinus]|uniref:PQQ-binding-like beta-propeller repeat protein n=1 Tax=Gelatiniphilus marinus TaxID=1759464 RepID=A0ABW5JSV1_9FLAO